MFLILWLICAFHIHTSWPSLHANLILQYFTIGVNVFWRWLFNFLHRNYSFFPRSISSYCVEMWGLFIEAFWVTFLKRLPLDNYSRFNAVHRFLSRIVREMPKNKTPLSNEDATLAIGPLLLCIGRLSPCRERCSASLTHAPFLCITGYTPSLLALSRHPPQYLVHPSIPQNSIIMKKINRTLCKTHKISTELSTLSGTFPQKNCGKVQKFVFPVITPVLE